MTDAPPLVSVPVQDRPLSAAAVASLVFGLLMCLPGAGVLGIVSGAIGLTGTGANGVRRGRGVAIAGFVLSAISILIWVVVAIGMNQAWNELVKPAMAVVIEGPDRTLKAASAGDGVTFDADWMPGRAPTEAERATFIAGVTLALGVYRAGSIEEGAQPPANSMSGNAEDFTIPWTFTFAEGETSGTVTYRPSRAGEVTPGGSYVAIDAIEIEGPDGTRFRLGGGKASTAPSSGSDGLEDATP